MIASWLAGYRKEWLSADIVAGLTAAAVVIPIAMAHSTIAGLPVQVGLYTALVPMAIYALLGTSRVLSVSTTSTIAILVGTELARLAPDGEIATLLRITATLALIVGAILVAASLFRLGFVADFISEPVLIGFKAGIGVVIVLDQMPKLLGVRIVKGSFLHNLQATAQALPDTSLLVLAVSVGTILLLVGLRRYLPKVPAPLIAIAAGMLAAGVLGLESRGVPLIGDVPQGVPSFVMPDLSLLAEVWPAALGIALMSFTETTAVGRSFAMIGDPPLSANRELLATGLANAGGALLGAMPNGGGASQTAVNRSSGAKTQLAGLVTAAAALLIMLFLAAPMGLMPQATLAAVVVVYSVGLIKPAAFRAIRQARRLEFRWALASTAGVVLLGTLKGILAAIVISLVSLAQQAASPPVYALGRKRGTSVFRPVGTDNPNDETFPGLLMARVEGRLFFFNAARVGERLRFLAAEAQATTVAIDMSAVFDLEYTALKALIEGEARLRAEGMTIWLVGLTPSVLEMVRRSPLEATLGRERMLFNLETAVERYLSTSP